MLKVFVKFKNILFYSFVLSFIFNFQTVFALEIKNVYLGNSASDRWIEVFNDGEDINDLTLYKIKDSTSDSKRSIIEMSGIKSFPKNSTIYIYKSLSPVSKISESLPTNTVSLFRSSFALPENSWYISIIDSEDTILACKSYGNGVCPTSSNENTNNNSTSTNASSTNTNNNTQNNSGSNVVYVYVNTLENKYGDINMLLPETREVPALADVDYTIKITDSQKNLLDIKNISWSFGDGGERFGKDVNYYYTYPGEYTLIAEADGFKEKGQAKMKVIVYDAKLEITKVGMGGIENFIEIKNNTNYDLYLSNFYLNLDNQFYKLPKNFVIAKNKSVKIDGNKLNFKLPATNVSILYPNKNLLKKYEYTALLATSTESGKTILAEVKDIKSNVDFFASSSNILVKNNIKSENQKIENKNPEIVIAKKSTLKEDFKSENSSGSKILIPKNNNTDTGIINWIKSIFAK